MILTILLMRTISKTLRGTSGHQNLAWHWISGLGIKEIGDSKSKGITTQALTEVGSLQKLTPTLPGCHHRKPSPRILGQQNVGGKKSLQPSQRKSSCCCTAKQRSHCPSCYVMRW